MRLLETMVEMTLFEVKVPNLDTSSIKGTITEASEYHLTRDKVRRDIVPSQRENYVDLRYYALNMAKMFQNSEIRTFKEASESRWTQDG